MSPTGVYQRRPAVPKTIRTLRADEPRPAGEPRRYADRNGYIRLRWRVGVSQYVEVREHRAVMSADDGRQVHHIDHNPANNDPANLLLVTPEEHQAIHAQERRKVNIPLAVAMYRNGMSTKEIAARMGVDHSNVYRRLAPFGVLRTEAEAGALRRTHDEDDRILELHARGLNAGQIARVVGIGPDAVRCALRRHGRPVGRAGRPSLAMRQLEESLRA